MLGESLEVVTVSAQRHTLAPSTALKSHPTSSFSPNFGLHARMVSGRGKRPLNVDAGATNKGSVRAVVESGHMAYL